jgi:peptide/nickel transport system substrate-binding protein/oligopeptide transport system substrate-binding protein
MAQVEPTVLDPAFVDDAYEAALVNQIFDGLLEFDANFNTLPGVAEAWHITRDGRVYTFELQKGIRFHDGTEVRAGDFAYSFTRVFRLDPEQSVLAREYLGHILGAEAFATGAADSIQGLEVLGPYRLRIVLERPYASFLAVLASEQSRVVPRDYVESVGDEAFGRNPVGCGPFALSRWERGRRIVLEAFQDHHRGRAHLDSLVYETPGGAVRDIAIQDFLEGRLSAVELTMGGVEAVRRLPEVVIHRRQELSLSFVAFNLSRAPFDDSRVRRAFAHALDLDRLQGMTDGGRVRPNGILPPGFPGYSPEDKLLGYDLERARALLADAGYPDGEGLPEIRHGMGNHSDSDRALLEEIRAQVRRAGFEMTPLLLNWDEFHRGLQEGRFESFSLTWVADIPDPDSFFYPLFHSQGSNNYGAYRQPEVDRLLSDGRVGRTAGARIDVYRLVERKILHDAPIVPLNHSLATIAVRSALRGFTMTAMGAGNLTLESVWFASADDRIPRAEEAR